MRIETATRALHEAVFRGEEDYIPLIVSLPAPDLPSKESLALDPGRNVPIACAAQAERENLDDDWIPTINIGHFQNVVVPSLFGAKIVSLDGSEPICETRFSSAEAAAEAGIPELSGPRVDELFDTVDTALSVLPEGWRLSMPPVSSPFDLAQLLLGEDFLVGLYTEPEAVAQFLDYLTDLVIRLTRRVKTSLGLRDDEYITNRGLFFPGLRQPCDAIVNLSPGHIETFVLPVLEKLGGEFGRICVHYCTTPSPSFHVLPALLGCACVGAVDNWQGPEAFIGEAQPARNQDRIAVITDLELRSRADVDTFFAHPAVAGVPRRGGRGLVIGTKADSAAEARELLSYWRSRQAGRPA